MEGRGKGEKERERGKRGGKRKEKQEKKENGEEKKGNCKRGGGKLKMEGERYENEQRTLFFLFFSLSLFETTLFGVYQNENFSGEKIEKWESF